MINFDRKYSFKSGERGGKGIEISPPLNIDFFVDKTPEEKPNEHVIKIFNLSKETYEQISEIDNFCVLSAGYSKNEESIVICSGEVLESYIERNGRDVITVLILADGLVSYRDTAISVGFSSKIDAHSIIKDISKKMGLSLMMNENLPNRFWNNGFSHFGAAHEALHKVVRATDLEWSIQNNILQIVKQQSATSRRAVVVSSETGMIGSPERVKVGAKDKKSKDKKKKEKRQAKDGWRVEMLLTPQLNPRDKVKITSKDVNGFFVVESVKNSGSYQGGQWKTIIEVLDE